MGSAVFRSDHTAGPKTAGRDAALFITKLPKAEHKAEHKADEWQAPYLIDDTGPAAAR
jgi:hypothetical protein